MTDADRVRILREAIAAYFAPMPSMPQCYPEAKKRVERLAKALQKTGTDAPTPRSSWLENETT
jgi:hypothetical protein